MPALVVFILPSLLIRDNESMDGSLNPHPHDPNGHERDTEVIDPNGWKQKARINDDHGPEGE